MKDRNEVIRILVRKFPREALKERQGGRGQMFTYIEGHTAIHRLNEATDNNWNFEIVHMPPMIPMGKNKSGKEQYLITVQGRLSIPGLGSRDDVGVQMITMDGGEDLYKGAVRDCLKRCASNFGVALELYGDNYEAPPLVQAPTKRQLAEQYQRTTGQMMTRELYEQEVQKRFGKNPDDVLDSEAQEWVQALRTLDTYLRTLDTYTEPQREEPSPTPLADAVKRGRKTA